MAKTKKTKQISNQNLFMTLIVIALAVLIIGGVIYFASRDADLGMRMPGDLIPKHTIPAQTPADSSSQSTDMSSSGGPAAQTETKQEQTPAEKCADLPEGEKKLNCEDSLILTEVLKSGLLQACDELKLKMNQDFCRDAFYKKEATEKKDKTFCAKITNPTVQAACENEILMAEAVEAGDAEKCNALSDAEKVTECKDKIALGQAFRAEELAKCDVITDASKKALCREKVSAQVDNTTFANAVKENDLAACSLLSGQKRTDCQNAINFNLGVSENDLSLCAKVTDEIKQNTCADIVNKALAVEKMEASYCVAVQDEDMQKSCVHTLNGLFLKKAIQENNASLCNQITDNDEMQEKCLSIF